MIFKAYGFLDKVYCFSCLLATRKVYSELNRWALLFESAVTIFYKCPNVDEKVSFLSHSMFFHIEVIEKNILKVTKIALCFQNGTIYLWLSRKSTTV